jgi:membrane protein YdbS with pleckstrin-like domain
MILPMLLLEKALISLLFLLVPLMIILMLAIIVAVVICPHRWRHQNHRTQREYAQET